MKATAIAPSNIALTKYWGKKDEKLRLPENGSIAMCLSNLTTTTTVEFSPKFKKDSVSINGEIEKGEESRAVEHLDRIRKIAKISDKARVVSINNFPKGTGLSSSASGFAALTLAGAVAAGLDLSEKELSVLARQGSGSACRSIPDGFVEWLDGNTSEESFAKTIFPPDYWDIVDIVAVVSSGKKEVATSAGMGKASSSPFQKVRVKGMRDKNKRLKELIKEKNFGEFGELIEKEALELHAIMLTQTPSLLYWLPGTVEIMRKVRFLRNEGLPVYFTVNTGQDIHLIIEKKNQEKLIKLLRKEQVVKKIIPNDPGMGARFSDKYLF